MSTILYAASSGRHLCSFHLPYIRALREAGHRVILLSDFTGTDKAPLGETVHLPFRKRMIAPRNLLTAIRVARLLRREKIDLAVLNTALASFWVRLGICLVGRKDRPYTVDLVHGYLFDRQTGWMKRSLLLASQKLVRRVTDEVWVMNREDETIATEQRLSRGAVRFLPGMGMDASRFVPDGRSPAQARAGSPYEGETPLLMYIGELSRRKRQSLLLDALAQPALRDRPLRLLLVGTGGEEQALKQKAQALGLGDRVLFAGQVPDPERYYPMAELYLAPSRLEGLPFHVMEAMCAGRAVVASRIKGHTDLLEAADGQLIPLGGEEAAAWAKAIGDALDDPARRADQGARNQAAVQPYAFETVFPKVQAELQAVCRRAETK